MSLSAWLRERVYERPRVALALAASAAVLVGFAVGSVLPDRPPDTASATPSMVADGSGLPEATDPMRSADPLSTPLGPVAIPAPTARIFDWPPKPDASGTFLHANVWAVSTVDNLNVRAGPSTDRRVVGQLDTGDLVMVIEGGEAPDSWAHIAADGLTGWANAGPSKAPWLKSTPTPWKAYRTALAGVASNGSTYLAFGNADAHDYLPYEGGDAALVLVSDDGVKWTSASEGLHGRVLEVAAGPTGWVALTAAYPGVLMAAFSTDGRTWHERAQIDATNVAYGPAGWVAIGGSNAWGSADGQSWGGPSVITTAGANREAPEVLESSAVAYVAFQRDPARIWSTTDGRTWVEVELADPSDSMIADAELIGDRLAVSVRHGSGVDTNYSSRVVAGTVMPGGAVHWDLEPVVFDKGFLVASISGGPDGLLALGWDREALVPVLWRSTDGKRWQRLDASETALGGAVGPEPAWGTAGWVALGTSSVGAGPRDGMLGISRDGAGQQLWRSADGSNWVRTGDSIALHVEPPCPPARRVSTLVLIYLGPFAERCFGDATLTVRGSMPFIDGIGGCCWPTADPDWLAGVVAGGYIGPAKVDFGPAVLPLFVPPGVDADALRAGKWVEVVGHYRDKAAAECDRTPLDGFVFHRLESLATVRRDCEQRFVVESIRSVDGP